MVSHEMGVWASIAQAKTQRRGYFVLDLSTFISLSLFSVVDCGRLRPVVVEVVRILSKLMQMFEGVDRTPGGDRG